jgi:hypothetical protein
MRLSSRWSNALLLAAVVILPLKSGGCGRTACITLTQAQLANTAGMCPDAMTAQSRLVDTVDCSGPVASVDGPGDLSDGNLCCYPVTLTDSNASEDCGSGVGGGFSGEVSVSSSVSGIGGFGGAGGGLPSMCATCPEALTGAPFNDVCSAEQPLLSALQICACNGTCMSLCDPTLCVGNQPDNGCLSCLQTSCNAQLMACQQG